MEKDKTIGCHEPIGDDSTEPLPGFQNLKTGLLLILKYKIGKANLPCACAPNLS